MGADLSHTQSPSATPERPSRPVALVSLRGDKEFRKVRAHGIAIRDPLFTLRITEYRPRYGEVWRPRAIIGIVVSKKTLKRAVQRNRVRRRIREALRTLPGGLPPCRAILLPTTAILDVPFAELQAALLRALTRGPGKGPGRAQSGRRPKGQGHQPQQLTQAPVVPQAPVAQESQPAPINSPAPEHLPSRPTLMAPSSGPPLSSTIPEEEI